ncbi:MAG TPA: helix-turn-helix domain-containing protein [Candidatus Angelobacter sp.]|nr:helix-turn-helix domain-containing protein [Candidatus Angelobacter sp.]
MAPTLGESIRRYRQRKGWTLKDLAAATGLSVPYLSDLERRPGVNPTLDTLTSIALALGCTVADLVGDGAKPGEPSALPPTLARLVRSDEFEQEVQLISRRSSRSVEEVRSDLTAFLAVAPKRSSGELSVTDWRRLMDVYRVITEDR